MFRFDFLPIPQFIRVFPLCISEPSGIILSPGLIRKLGKKRILEIITSLDISVMVFEEAEEAKLNVIDDFGDDQIWLVKHTVSDKVFFTLMLSSEF
ncbi:MAG: hypothetical protein ACXAB7_10940 [Candidatus Kariarchaeaceae archaeon]|jgi:hypothetical protein